MTNPLMAVWSAGSVKDIVADSGMEVWSSQKAWSMAVDAAAVVAFDGEASTRMTQLRRLQAGAHAGAWITNFPLEKEGCPTFTAAEWQALLRFRCGVPFQARCRCGGCAAALDSFGDHALSCCSCGLYARHNRLRDALAAEFLTAGQPLQVEAQLPGSSLRPADILVLEPGDLAPVAVDVAVVHPLHPSALSAEDTPGTAAASREAEKRATSAKACEAQGWRFAPVCAECTGGWGPGAQKCVRALIRRQSMRSGEPVAVTAGAVWRRLTTAVAKGAAQMLLRAFPGSFGGAGALVAHSERSGAGLVPGRATMAMGSEVLSVLQ